MEYKDLQQLEEAKKQWYDKFDNLMKLIDMAGGIASPTVHIISRVRTEPHVYKSMRLLFISVSHRWIADDIILNFIDDENPDHVVPIIVARAFEAKAFGDIQGVPEFFDFLIHLFDINDYKMIKQMAKVDYYKKGTPVRAKRFNGEVFLGVYEHSYDDGSHCVSDGKKLICCHHKDVREANEEEKKTIQETIIKPRREEEKRKKAEAAAAAAEEEVLTVEDLEEKVDPEEE